MNAARQLLKYSSVAELIDEVTIYQRALSDQEISAIYKSDLALRACY
jgi:hypothetical protein